MEFSVGDGDWTVVRADPGATVEDIARAAGVPAAGLGAKPDTPLARWRLPRGTTAGASLAAEGGGLVVLTAVSGLDAGRRVVLPGGPVELGRDADPRWPSADATVSRAHAALSVDPAGIVTVADLGSRNGTWLVGADGREAPMAPHRPTVLATGAVLRMGATELAVGRPATHDAPVARTAPPGLGACTPFNRPPRPAPAPAPTPVVVPDPPPPPAEAAPLGVVAVLAPVAMAAVLVVALGNPAYAILALLAPVVAVGSHAESRRRNRRARRRNAERRRCDLDRFAAALGDAASAEVARRDAAAPDPAEVVRRAELPSTRLWERRPSHPDTLVLRVGTGPVPWDPPLAGDRSPRPADVAAVVAAASTLPRAAATVELGGAGVVGVVGPRPAALAVARSLLCQAAVHHGPADLRLAVACAPGAVGDWAWTKWLPHTVDEASGRRWLAAGRAAADDLAALVRDANGPSALLVVDGDELLAGRRSPLRSLLGALAGVVVVEHADRLPAACTAVVDVGLDGDAELRVPGLGRRLAGLRAAGIAGEVAERCARALARFDDPELGVAGAGLPDTVRALDLLGIAAPTPEAVLARWRADDPAAGLVVPLGVDTDGPVAIDLVADGPHALVAGTTGAGKSELLRTLVAGLAASVDPDRLTFLLVDFKGGGAFDACARLPHVVGLVTDLDEDLAARALRCLEAELRYRERVLRAAGADSLAGYRRVAAGQLSPLRPLPRLAVVVDEFATLKAEVPGFVDALVGVAQRGRSLGVHLVLATQRPAGAVSDQIRANTNLRIALRVADPADSSDVVDAPDAARLPRGRPGRACVRFGPGELATLQTALASAPAATGPRPPVHLVPFEFGPGEAPAEAPAAGERTDLDLLVDACVEAWSRTGRPAPRRPWPDPLPPVLDRAVLAEPTDPGLAAVALADDPDGQRQVVTGWRPADGNLLVLGCLGTGTTTTLVAVALALAETHAPDRLHLYAVDLGAGGLDCLATLPHVGAIVGAGERERQHRLVRRLRAELARRRELSPAARELEPLVVLVVDGVAGFLAEFDDVAGLEVLDAFERVFADGPEVGLHLAVAADRPGALPTSLAALVRQRWVHRLADPLDVTAAGAAAPVDRLVPGRFVDTASGLVAQVGVPGDGWAAAVDACAAGWHAAARSAPPVGSLPDSLAWPALRARARLGPEAWHLPIGVADDDLAPASLVLWEGEHALVTGPARSGRTTALATIATAVLDAGGRALALAGRRSWQASLDDVTVADDGVLAALVAEGTERPTVLLVDDAETVDDAAGHLAALLAAGWPGLHVVAAGRAEVLRGLYDHWTRTVRRFRAGVLLRPHLDLDGELLGTSLPRRVHVPLPPGRGFVVADGTARLVHVATPA